MLNKKKKQKKSDAKNGFKVLLAYGYPYKTLLAGLTIISVFLALLNAGTPLAMGKLVDSVIELNTISFLGVEWPAYIIFISLLLLLNVLELALLYISNLQGNLNRDKFMIKYKKRVSRRIMSFPFSFHKEKKYGSWSTSLERANFDIARIIFLDLKNLLPSVIFFFIATSILFTMDYTLGLILFVGIVLYVISILNSNKKLGGISEKELVASKKMGAIIFESFSNILEVKKSSSENDDYSKMKKFAEKKYLPTANKRTHFWSNTFLVRGIISTTTRITILFSSIYLVLNGTASVGDLFVVNVYARSVFTPLSTIGNFWTYWYEALVRINDAEKILKTETEDFEPNNVSKLPIDFKGEIEFDKVEFSYKDKDKNVLNKINLKIEQGQKVAFVGESGVGKSTAIDLIGGFYFPQKGAVKIDGIDSRKLGLADLRSKIAFVSQEISLFNDTVENNIKYGSKKAKKEDVLLASKKAFADDFIKDFPKKYKQKVGNRGIKLSGGQKQRISIARAILRDPKILILDEPTSSLDIRSEKYITESLDDLMKGRTTIIIAHRLSTVRNVDKIFVFKNGKIVEEGSHSQLLKIKNGEYKNMHDMHIGLN